MSRIIAEATAPPFMAPVVLAVRPTTVTVLMSCLLRSISRRPIRGHDRVGSQLDGQIMSLPFNQSHDIAA